MVDHAMTQNPQAAIHHKCRELIMLLNINLNHFPRSLKRNDIPSIVSIIGNAKHSASYNHFCRRIRTERPDLIHQLPERHRYACTNLPLHQSR